MARRPTDSLLSSLGMSRAVDHLYQRVQPLSGRSVEAVADAVFLTPADLLVALEPLLQERIVTVEAGRIEVLAPGQVLMAYLDEQAAAAGSAADRLARLVKAVPFLTAPTVRPAPGEVVDVLPINGEISSGGSAVPLLEGLVSRSHGDLLWLRPDLLEPAREEAMCEVVRRCRERGRRSRAIYPLTSWRTAEPVLRARAQAGEEVRLLPDVPTRMFVIGTTHVVLPEPLGSRDEPRSLIRQRGLVEALTMLFEQFWERAAPLPDVRAEVAESDLRRFVLQLLASGLQDEQIARRLGVSLRTIRRRVADLLTETGADTRFQAGVEATRRGWV